MINKMVMELRFGPTALSSKETMSTAKRMAPATLSGMMAQTILGTSKTITLKVWASTSGPIAAATTENGEITKCMVTASSHG